MIRPFCQALAGLEETWSLIVHPNPIEISLLSLSLSLSLSLHTHTHTHTHTQTYVLPVYGAVYVCISDVCVSVPHCLNPCQ